jgi:outer membrane protein assembly factor BamB
MKSPVLLLTALILCAPVQADDWPQWRGPNRDDVSHETGLLKAWPAGGPRLLWTYHTAGIGFSGPAIVGDHLYMMGADSQTEYVYALDTRKGERLWQTPIGQLYRNNYGDGPRGTPAVDGDRLYCLSAQGNLNCVEVASGTSLWSVSLTSPEIAGGIPNWGYAESPLVDGDHVVCTPGGDRGSLAAFDKRTGKLVWRSRGLHDPAGYASMIAAEVGGQRLYVQTTMQGIAGVAARDGKPLWHYRQPAYRTAVIPTPIFHDGYVYATAGYGAGCDLLHLVPEGLGMRAEKVYSSKAMDNKHGGVVLVGEHLYGWTDQGGGAWICQEFKTGQVVWRDKHLGRGSVTCADGRLYCYSESDGTAMLVEASPDGWKEHGRFTIPEHTSIRRKYSPNIWTHPVVANARLYLRDQDLLFCFDVQGR